MDIERIRSVIAQMTLSEKLSLIGGGTVTASVDRLKVESVDFGSSLLPYAVNEPSELALGCTFSREVVSAVAKTVSQEAARTHLAFGGTVGCGLITDPMKIDASDCFSEDPYLAGQLLSAVNDGSVLGFVYKGALGQGEYNYRTIDGRALREVYLYPLKKAGSNAAGVIIDGGYLNGEEVGASRDGAELITGYVPSDAAVFTRSCGLKSMPVGDAYRLGTDNADRREIAREVINGKLFENKTARAIERTVNTVVKTHEFYKKQFDRTPASGAEDLFFASAVLLKNDGTLPCGGLSVEIFGDPKAFDDGKGKIRPVKDTARSNADVAVFAVTDYYDGIPSDTLSAIENAAKSRRVVVVLCGDCAAELPFADSVSAIVFCPYYKSAGEIEELVKKREPRGRLPFTWCKKSGAYPANNPSYGDRGDFRYSSVYNGYTYFDGFASDEVLFPFGHGLGYTEYEIDKLKLSAAGSVVTAAFDIKNVGSARGTAVVQAYASYCGKGAYGLRGRLGAFTRIELDAGETKRVELTVDISDFALFDETSGTYKIQGGKYEIAVGLSSRDIRVRGSVKADGDKKVSAGLSERDAPSYYKTGEYLRPTAPEIEKLLKVPFVKKPCLPNDKPTDREIKGEIKRAKKTVNKRLFARAVYKIKNTPIK